MSTSMIRSLTPERLRELMQQAGYRAEIITGPDAPSLRSATGGLPFEIRFVNATPGDSTTYADIMFLAGLQVQGELSLDIVNRWNSTKRFARLHLSQNYLVLAMDVVVLGGVAPEHLGAQIELWDRLLQELLSYLRSLATEQAAKNGAAAAPMVIEPQPDRASAG
jgi:hypothetical protein